MALLQVNYASRALKKNTTFQALIPIDTLDAANQKKKNLKSIYLLHGYSGNYTDWVCGTKIQEISTRCNIAVFMPSGENSFYLDDNDKGELFGEYVGNELVEYTRSLFPLSNKREDTFIGGLSMGGYGAILNGLKYSENYSKIIALSSALITNKIANIPAGYKDEIADYKYYSRVFGNLRRLKGSDRDPETLVTDMKKKKAPIPEIYMACGTDDFLLGENRSFHNFLEAEQVGHTYLESPGVHNWDFWNEHIEKALIWATAR